MQAILGAGIVPTRYIGTSMGAVMAAMFAGGATPDEALAKASAVDNRDAVRLDRLAFLKGLWARQILRPAGLRTAIRQLVPVERFSDLKTPLSVTATDADSGDLVYFGASGRDAPLIDALMASCALPLFYPAVSIGGRRYLDGGLRAVLPLDLAASFEPNLVIVVDVGAGFDEDAPKDSTSLPPLLAVHSEATRILMAQQTGQALALWRTTPGRPRLVYIRPPAERGATFRVDLVRRYVDQGREAAAKALMALNL
jgi:NTE family protein